MKGLDHNRTLHSFALVTLSFLVSTLLHILLIVCLVNADFYLIRALKNSKPVARSVFVLEDIKRIISTAVARDHEGGAGKGAGAGDAEGAFKRQDDSSVLQAGEEADGKLTGREVPLLDHEQAEGKQQWQHRQEILAISGRLIGKDIVKGNRRLIPEIARFSGAQDVVYPINFDELKPMPAAGGIGGLTDAVKIVNLAPLRSGLAPGLKSQSPGDGGKISGVIDKKEREERKIDPLDNFLKAGLTVFEPLFGSEKFFMLEIERISDELLPRVPKDIVFLQDASSSIGEQWLYYCREGVTNSLNMLMPDDRFEVIAFRDRPVSCFGGWVAPDQGNLEKGRRFVSNMRAAGNTDIMVALEALKKVKVEPGRPCLAVVITDGMATTGIVETAQIIRDFSRNNTNGVAVYTVAVTPKANMYLLDLLSYSNGGSTHVVRGGRWSINDNITNLVSEISRPVLSGLQIAFAGRNVEIYPSQVRHLFMDDKLVFYGRCPKSMKRATFQAIGSAGKRKYDMIFDIPFDGEVVKGGRSIARDWGFQKAYHLIGEMIRSGDRSLLKEINGLASEYKLQIPHESEL